MPYVPVSHFGSDRAYIRRSATIRTAICASFAAGTVAVFHPAVPVCLHLVSLLCITTAGVLCNFCTRYRLFSAIVFAQKRYLIHRLHKHEYAKLALNLLYIWHTETDFQLHTAERINLHAPPVYERRGAPPQHLLANRKRPAHPFTPAG